MVTEVVGGEDVIKDCVTHTYVMMTEVVGGEDVIKDCVTHTYVMVTEVVGGEYVIKDRVTHTYVIVTEVVGGGWRPQRQWWRTVPGGMAVGKGDRLPADWINSAHWSSHAELFSRLAGNHSSAFAKPFQRLLIP